MYIKVFHCSDMLSLAPNLWECKWSWPHNVSFEKTLQIFIPLSIDVEGVLEDPVLALPAKTAMPTRALGRRRHFTISAKSLQILIYPCRQLQLKLIIYIFRRLLLVQNLKGLPVLVAAGAEDILVPLKSAHVLATKIANSTLIPISGCGHLPHEECPKALLAALIPFVSRLHKISQKT